MLGSAGDRVNSACILDEGPIEEVRHAARIDGDDGTRLTLEAATEARDRRKARPKKPEVHNPLGRVSVSAVTANGTHRISGTSQARMSAFGPKRKYTKDRLRSSQSLMTHRCTWRPILL